MRSLFRALLLAISLGIALAPAAQAKGSHPRLPHHDQHYHGQNHHGQHHSHKAKPVTTVSVTLNEKARNEVIPLRRLLDLDSDYRGYKIHRLVVHLRERKHSGRLSLLANGQEVDSARTKGRHSVTLSPSSRQVLGHTTRRLQLAVDGKAFIRSIDVQIRPTRAASHRGDRTKGSGPVLDEDFARVLAAEIVRILAQRSRTHH